MTKRTARPSHSASADHPVKRQARQKRASHLDDFGEFDHHPRSKNQKYLQQPKSEAIYVKGDFKPKSFGQEFYVNLLNECDIIFAAGPAGCGKTWIATRIAIEKLLDHTVERIIVTKPILEAGGEKLGHLPGEIEDKILPHFQSVLDCFEDHLGPTVTKRLIESGHIKFLPTAYARGRSLQNSFILIDEAQNLTRKGIKLLLTRIAEGSIMSLNGDTDQSDLPNPKDSGFDWAVQSLKGKSPNIGVVELNNSDIQRHPLIETILVNLR